MNKDESDDVQISTSVPEWTAARTQLADTTQSFSTASASVQPSDSLVEASTLDHPGMTPDKLDIEKELRALELERNRLGDAFALPKVKRNESLHLVPIDRISEDILMRIFATVIAWDDLSCDTIIDIARSQKRSKTVLVLSGVNVAWRHLMINTPSFWTHLDVQVSDTSYSIPKHTQLYLERVKDAPVDLHILSTIHDEDEQITRDVPASLTNRAISSLSIESFFNQVHAEALVKAWLGDITSREHARHRDLHSLRVLVKRGPRYEDEDEDELQAPTIETPSLPRISTLQLSDIGMNWNTTSIFTGLVDLDLSNLGVGSCPSMKQLQAILLSNPELRILRLFKIDSDIPTESHHVVPTMTIELPRLQFLGLGHLPWCSMTILLKTITPGPEFSCLNISHPDFADEGLELLKALCSGHKVTTLSLDAPIHHEQHLATFLRSLHSLHTLNLSHLSLETNAFPDILSNRSGGADSGTSTALGFPRIQKLRFSRCKILASTLKELVAIHPIGWLTLDYCNVFESDRKSTTWPWHSLRLPAMSDTLVDWLSSEVQELCINSTDTLAFRDLPWWLQ